MRGKGFFGQPRRERQAYPIMDLEGASNESLASAHGLYAVAPDQI
jgi:hypothetical protein